MAIRVLITDDNADLADSLSMALQLDGYEVKVAYSAVQALELIETFQPHVAILDICMPGIDGYQLARRVRARSRTHPALIALTGCGQPQDKARSFAAGFNHHLVKPLQPAELEAILIQWLDDRLLDVGT